MGAFGIHVSSDTDNLLLSTYSDGPQPYSQILLPPLVPQQRYDISAQLVVPITESNLALGNFMTSLTLSTLANKTLISIRRPVSGLVVVLWARVELFN